MKKTALSALALSGALMLALTACGTTQPTASADGGKPAESASADCAADSTATSTGPVTLTDAFDRTVELDKPAERVAVLEWQQIEDALTLCVTPVAVADASGYSTWVSAEELPKDVVDVGTRQEPNLDALFAAEPDLVIVEAYTRDDAIIAQLEEYGVPVLATLGADAADPIAQMLSTFDLIAQATGREERAAAVTEEFEAHLAEAKAEITGLDVEVDSFVFFDGWVDGSNVSLRPFGQGSLVGEVGEELGLTNAWTGEVDAAYGLGQTDIEGMTAVGDASLFYTGTEEEDGSSFMDAVETNPVWKSLPAVQDDRLQAFPAGLWTFGGPRSTELIIDAYLEVLAK
ncbi:iron-siderophore ABC transporter substrate-binding protein [Microbacterium sp. SD291]|uniref:ABC transporter substrate-binding protein n=1 Tax=Microbacterium sp. SD291 TaxID=2782007 RepID=UPI001A977396|nr:iron-siderophore ABC transporter substrate-binding protein [Microbacterium sp. SD291]MBO0980680.1 iron-siderophore ABC transporter substrate-binding protein [Microbacterium sp. SD291]